MAKVQKRPISLIKQSPEITIGELSRLMNEKEYQLRHYSDSLGIIPFRQEGEMKTRWFDREKSIQRVQEINKLKRQGYKDKDLINYFNKNLCQK